MVTRRWEGQSAAANPIPHVSHTRSARPANSQPTRPRLTPLAAIASIIFGFSFSAACVFGKLVWDSLYASTNIALVPAAASATAPSVVPVPAPFDVVAFLLFGVAVSAAGLALSTNLPRIRVGLARIGLPYPIARAFDRGRLHPGLFAASVVLLLVAWSPYAVLLAPGSFTYDAIGSIIQGFGSGALPMGIPLEEHGAFVAQKPMLHTWALDLFALAGEALGSVSAGLFSFCLAQMTLTAIALARACWAIPQLGAPRVAALLSYAFALVFPLVPLYAMSGWNDAMFSWIFVLWLVEYAFALRGCTGRARTLSLAAFSVLLCLTKPTGIYLVVISLVALAIVRRRSRRLVAAALSSLVTAALVSLVLFPHVLYPITQTVKGPSGEALGVAFQATARYVSEHADEIPASDRETIDKVLDYESLGEAYRFDNQDSVKVLERGASFSDLVSYLAVWAKEGMDDPLCYAASLLGPSAPFLIPNADFKYYDSAGDYRLSIQRGYVEHDMLAWQADPDPLAQALNRLAVVPDATTAQEQAQFMLRDALDAATELPLGGGVGLGLYAFWGPLACCLLLVRGRSGYVALAVPIVVSMLFLFISPRAMARYALPLAYGLPLLLSLAFALPPRSRRARGPQRSRGPQGAALQRARLWGVSPQRQNISQMPQHSQHPQLQRRHPPYASITCPSASMKKAARMAGCLRAKAQPRSMPRAKSVVE